MSTLEIAYSGANLVSDRKVAFTRNLGCALAGFYGHYSSRDLHLLIILVGPCLVTIVTCLGTRFIMGSKHVDGPISIRELATDIEGSLDTIGSGNCLLVNRVNYVSILVSFDLNSIIINGHDSQIFAIISPWKSTSLGGF